MKKKRCFKCERVLPRSHFYHHPEMADGLLGKCKECTKSDVRLQYEVTKEERHEYERRRNQTPERRAALRAAARRHRERNPEKYRARTAVSNAIRDGRLERGPCEVCGAEKVQGHHADYSKPLEVRWLCFEHHREIEHGQEVSP